MLNGLIKYNIPIALLGNVRIANQYQVQYLCNSFGDGNGHLPLVPFVSINEISCQNIRGIGWTLGEYRVNLVIQIILSVP